MTEQAGSAEWSRLREKHAHVPLDEVSEAIDRLAAAPDRWPEVAALYDEAMPECYARETYESVTVPVVLSEAARQSPAVTAGVAGWLVKQMVAAGEREDESQLELLMEATSRIGLPGLAAATAALDRNQAASAADYLWGVIRRVALQAPSDVQESALRRALKAMEEAFASRSDVMLDALYLLSDLRHAPAEPVLTAMQEDAKRGERSPYRFLRADLREAIKAVRGEGEFPGPEERRTLDTWLSDEFMSLKNWYRDRAEDDDLEEMDYGMEPEEWEASEPSPFAEPPPTMPIVRPGAKVGRNDPCPCGSGKKFKKCCGRGG